MVVQSVQVTGKLNGHSAPQSLSRRFLRKAIHVLSNRFIFDRRRTRSTRAAGFDLVVGPTVFHPRWFITSQFFAGFIDKLNLQGKSVADVGTGSGILALAAARAGAARIVAIDVNPNAVRSAAENAIGNGLSKGFEAVHSDLLSALPPDERFDVIFSSPPSFPGEPLDLADRAWHAGPEYRDIAALFEQARERLGPGGRFYILLSSDSDLSLLGHLAENAGFHARIAEKRSILIEDLIIYELRPLDNAPAGAEARDTASAAIAPGGT